MVLNLLKSL